MASKRKVMCRDGVTECPEPEHTGCNSRRKLCDDYDYPPTVPVPEPSEGEVRCATCATAERKCSTCPDMPEGYYDTNWTPEEARAIEGETP